MLMDLFENIDVSIGLNFLLIRAARDGLLLLATEIRVAYFKECSRLRKRDRSTNFFSRKLRRAIYSSSCWF